MAQPSEDQIRAAWRVDGQPYGIPYPDYKAQVLARGGAVMPTAASGGGGGMGDSDHSADGGGEDFLTYLAHATGGDIPYRDGTTKAKPGDGSLDYYDSTTAKIDAALKDPDVSDATKIELRQVQQDLDAQYLPQRQDAATKKLQGAGSDDEALAALQALEGLRTSAAGSGGAGSTGGGGTETIPGWGTRPKQTVDPKRANGLPTYDPWDEARAREEWEQDFKPKGVSWEEYKAMVLEANPNGSLRYTSPTAKNIGRGGSAKTFIGDPDPRLGGGTANPNAVRNAEISRAASLGYFDNVTQRALNDLGSKNKETDEAAKQTLSKLAESGALTKQQTSAISAKLTKAAEDSNAESSASTQRLTKAVTSTNASNNAALDSYISGIKPYQNEIAGTTRQNVQFDPEGLNAQRQSLAQARAIAGGSLDYESQGAKAYANPEDIARALEGIGMLRENAVNGGKEQKKNLEIARDEYEHGGDNQREVLEKYRAISNPEMTAAERAILAQSQRQFAIHDKANRDAVSRDLESRGVMSGAGQIAQQQSSQQQLGEERVAGTLGAQAQAVQRALIGLQGMKDTATDLRTGNQNAEQLMQAAANALREGDLQAANAYTVAAQRQREQGFNEAYSRGIAADNASANNQSTRLGGAQLQGQQANAIRSANDAVNMFNNEQQGITDRYNTSFKQSEYDRLAGLQQSTLNNRTGVNQTNLGNESMLDTQTQAAIGDRFGRTNTAAQTGIGVAMGNHGIDQAQAGMELDEQRASQGRQERQTGTKINTVGQRVGLIRNTDDDVQRALMGL